MYLVRCLEKLFGLVSVTDVNEMIEANNDMICKKIEAIEWHVETLQSIVGSWRTTLDDQPKLKEENERIRREVEYWRTECMLARNTETRRRHQ